MRINVYAEELPSDCNADVQLVRKVDERDRVHYGIRMLLKSAPELHVKPNDDDRSAVTFWIPFEVGVGHRFDKLFMMFATAKKLCWDEARKQAHEMGKPIDEEFAIEK